MPTIAGREVGAIGYGLMGLTWRPQPITDEQAFASMKAAINAGSIFWNGGEFYGDTPKIANLELLNRYFTKYPEDAEKIVLNVKGGLDIYGAYLTPKCDRASVHKSIDNILRVLDGKKFLDVFECARVDPTIQIEETIAAIAEYVKAGKIGGIGLSEVSAATIRRAHAIHPIVSVEVEVSLWATEIFEKGGVADTCLELGIPIIAYSPLGRGFLTGELKSFDDIPEGDFRKLIDRFQPGNFERNLELVRAVQKLAEQKNVKPSQLALEWVIRQGQKPRRPVVIPIPSSTKVERVVENTTRVNLTDGDLKELDDLLAGFDIVGGRYFDAVKGELMV
jgi:pyridoxine 4-dehydrogenase